MKTTHIPTFQDFLNEDLEIRNLIREEIASVMEEMSYEKTINESDVEKISANHGKIVKQMSQVVASWKQAEGEEKQELLKQLKDLTEEKKRLEKQMNDAISGKDKDVELAMED
jgi:hypothetical protein